MELTIKELSKAYGDKQALEGFSYTFRPGVTAILGPNGAGKTTLMHLICDCVARQTGQILYNGTDVLKLGQRFRRVLGFMPQAQGMYEQMTAYDFLCYMARLKGLRGGQARAQSRELLRLVNLESAAHRRVGGFSGGMRHDEPTAGLDPEERVRLRSYLEDLGHSRILLITTHITSDVETVADRILLMEGGRLRFAADTAEFIAGCGARDLEDAYIRRLRGL